MYQRVVFGEVSDFLRGLGHRLTDVTPVEVLTLAPLAALTLLFGVFPGPVLELIGGPVDQLLAHVGGMTAGIVP
jgi:NADH-quinone oxidoreductase subunit M